MNKLSLIKPFIKTNIFDECFISSITDDSRVFSCGNGGSMCDAMHFAEELSGRFRENRRGLPAISISDPKLQQATIKKVGQEWYKQDKESVEAWLPNSGLEETQQKSIRNPPKKSWWQSMQEK